MSPVFAGKSYVVPQAAVNVDTTGLISIGLAPGGIVGMLGSSAGGVPNTLIRFSDASSVENYYRSGDLVDAAQLAFQHGAQVMYMCRIGTPLQSQLILKNDANQNLITLTSKDYGVWTNAINVKVEDGTTALSKKITIQYTNPDTGTITLDVNAPYNNLLTSQSIVDTINAQSGYVTATLSTGVSGLPANISYTPMVSGSDGPDLVSNDWSTGLETMKYDLINIIHPAGSDSAIVHALVQSHVDTYSNQKKERTAIVGHAIGDPVGAIGTANSVIDRAYNMNDSRMVLVTPGTDGLSAAFTAAKIVGLAAGVDVATPLTFKTISATAIEKRYTQSEIEQLITAGVLVIEEVTQGRRVVRNVTTKRDLGITTEDPFKEYSVQRIRDYVVVNLRDVLENNYIGKKGVRGVEGKIEATTSSILSKMKEDEIIYDYQNIVASIDPLNPTVINVKLELRPIQPINWIFINLSLVNTLS